VKWLYNLLGLKRQSLDEALAADSPTPVQPEPVRETLPQASQPAVPEPAPETPAEEALPVGEPEVPPWELGKPASVLDASQNRDHIVDVLSTYRESAESAAERQFLEALMNTVNREKMDLPAFPDVARELDALLRVGEPTMNQVVRLVEREPALVQRVWVRASSAEFDAPPKGLHFAISRIGFDDLWRIAIQVCLHSELFKVPGFQAQADHVRDHGMVCADVTADLGGERRGPLYIAGLLHDVGKLVVYRHSTVGLLYSANAPSLLDTIVTGLHSPLGILVAKAWGLGDDVAAALGFHHAPEKAAPEFQRHAWLVRAADVAVHKADAEQRRRLLQPSDAMKEAPANLHPGKDPLVSARRAFEDYKKIGV
jgi:HD-like signal output (HDOD) protein